MQDLDIVTRTLARDRLGVPSVLFFVMSAAAPLTVAAGVVTTGFAVTGIVGLPLAFAVVGAVLAVFSIGYVAMARSVANAGAFYAYVARGLGRPAGVGAAWVALLSYNGLQVGLYGAAGAAAAALLPIELPWYIVALAAWALVALLGVLRVDLNGTVLAILLVAEVGVIVAYDVAFLAAPAAPGPALAGFDPANLLVPGVGAVLVLAVLGFTGFESAVVFSEESKRPGRTVPIATYASVTLIALLYGISAWAMTVTVGAGGIVEASRAQGPELIFSLAADRLGGTAATIGHVLFATSILAAMISFHNTCARYFFAIGRERVLPRVFGAASERTGAPVTGSLVQSGIGLAVIVLYAAAGWDPLVQLFFWLGTGGGFGVLLLITTTSLAVLVYFARQGRALRRLVAPAVASVALVGMSGLAVANFPTLLGVAPDHPARWAIPAVYAVAGAAGVLYGLRLRRSRPEVYAGVGLGADAVRAGSTARRAW